MQRIPDDSSIAEAKAINLPLDFITTCDANNKCESNEPYQFKESTDSETFKMS